jgi:hypothetical protein
MASWWWKRSFVQVDEQHDIPNPGLRAPEPLSVRLRRYFPPMEWLPPYVRTNFADNVRADALAALTVACLAVPQSMAYALLAGVPPIHG